MKGTAKTEPILTAKEKMIATWTGAKKSWQVIMRRADRTIVWFTPPFSTKKAAKMYVDEVWASRDVEWEK